MKVSNITNSRGDKVPNQFIIGDELGNKFFQSYDSIIVKIEHYDIVKNQGNYPPKIYLDATYWNYSKTTSKYRNIFLEETTKETKAKIESGEYILTDLN